MAPRPYITSEPQLHDALAKWKDYSFVSGYLNLDAAVASLATDAPMVEPFSPYRGSWKVRPGVNSVSEFLRSYDRDSRIAQLRVSGSEDKREAMFHTAVLWLWNTDLETGNYVPEGENPGPLIRGKPYVLVLRCPSH